MSASSDSQAYSSSSSRSNSPSSTLCHHDSPPDETHTCEHPYHSAYWEGHLPPLLFRLDPPADREHGILTELEEDGAIVRSEDGAPIRNFPFLPRYIASNPPTWLIEYWMRTDARLTYRDIKARMTAPQDQQPTENALNMRREREVRGPLGLSCWAARRGRTSRVSRIDLERMESWTWDQIYMNTTMEVEYRFTHGAEPVPFRLRSKSLAADPVPNRYYPLDTFLGDDGTHVPSGRTLAAMDMFFQLAEKALARGWDSWRRLPAEDIQPIAWKPYSERPRRVSANIVEVEDEEEEGEEEDEEEVASDFAPSDESVADTSVYEDEDSNYEAE